MGFLRSRQFCMLEFHIKYHIVNLISGLEKTSMFFNLINFFVETLRNLLYKKLENLFTGGCYE